MIRPANPLELLQPFIDSRLADAVDPSNKGPEGLMGLALQNKDAEALLCLMLCTKCYRYRASLGISNV